MDEEEKQEALEQIAREKELRDIREVLGTPQGRRFLKRLFEVTEYFKAGNREDSKLIYREGKRSVGAKFFSDIVEACPDRVSEILKLS